MELLDWKGHAVSEQRAKLFLVLKPFDGIWIHLTDVLISMVFLAGADKPGVNNIWLQIRIVIMEQIMAGDGRSRDRRITAIELTTCYMIYKVRKSQKKKTRKTLTKTDVGALLESLVLLRKKRHFRLIVVLANCTIVLKLCFLGNQIGFNRRRLARLT